MLPKIPKFQPKNGSIVITLDRVLIGLVLILAVFAMVKVYSGGELAKNLVNSNATLLLGQINDVNDTKSFDKFFTGGFFCGWKIEREQGGNSSSADYEKTSEGKDILAREFFKNNIKHTFYLCIGEFDKINSFVNRQFFVVLLLSGAILFLLNIKLKPTNNETKIPNS
jgi:hypothetical protein